MNNEFPIDIKLQSDHFNDLEWWQTLEGALNTAVDTARKSLKTSGLSLDYEDEFEGESEQRIRDAGIWLPYEHRKTFSLPKIENKFSNQGLKKLLIGKVGISIAQMPRTAYDDPSHRTEIHADIKRAVYDLLTGRPNPAGLVLLQEQGFKEEDLLEDNLKCDAENRVKRRVYPYEMSKSNMVDSIIYDMNHRHFKYGPGNDAPMVVSIEMACAYNYLDKDSELRKELSGLISETAEKHNLYFGHLQTVNYNGSVERHIVGCGVKGGRGFLNPYGLTLVPADLENFSMEPMIDGIRELGKAALKYL